MTQTAQASRFVAQLKDLLADPDFDQVMRDIGVRLFEPYGNRPRLIQAIDRFVAKSTRFTTTALVVAQQPVKVVERDTSRIDLWLFNNGPNTVFIGQRAVSTGANLGDPNAGWPILNQASAAIGSVVGEIYAISASGNNDLRVVDLSG